MLPSSTGEVERADEARASNKAFANHDPKTRGGRDALRCLDGQNNRQAQPDREQDSQPGRDRGSEALE